MVSLMSEKHSAERSHLGLKKPKSKSKKKSVKAKTKKQKREPTKESESNNNNNNSDVEATSASQQLAFFIDEFQSANNVQLSSLELESINDSRILEFSQGLDQDLSTFWKHMKAAFGQSWKEMLCERQLLEGKVQPGSPSVLIVSASALRSLELLRGLRPLTKECPAAKLFSKHMKVEEQVLLLKDRTNIGGGTPCRIKKLIDIEALGLSRLAVIVLDMHMDVKGYSLFTLPQVRDEFWELYISYFHEKLVGGKLRICLYGSIPVGSGRKRKRPLHDE